MLLRGRRGDDDEARLLRRRALPSADHRRSCGRAPSRSASRSWSAITETFDFARGGVFGVLVQYPATDGAVRDYRALLRRARTRPARWWWWRRICWRCALLTPPGRARRRRRRRQRAALRRAAGLRRPARGVLRRRKDEFERKMPGRIIGVSQGRARQAGAAHGAADARAAHPPREGDQQHLHRAGAAGGHGQHVRGLPRARGPARDRRARRTA